MVWSCLSCMLWTCLPCMEWTVLPCMEWTCLPCMLYTFYFILNFFFGGGFFFFKLYSALLHLPPLRFHCADGCWDRTHTVIRFLWVRAKFNTCTVVRVNGTLVEDKMRRFKGECEHFASSSVPFILTTVQVPNLALTHKKWITVQDRCNWCIGSQTL